MVDPRVLEKATENAHDLNPLGQSQHSRAERANTTHHEVHVDSRLRGLVEGLDHRRIGKCVQFGPDVSWPTRARMLCLAVYQRQQPLEELRWRDEQVPQMNLWRVTR